MTDEFKDIRPYHDKEVPAIMKKLGRSREFAIGIRSLIFPHCPAYLEGVVDFIISRLLRIRFSRIKTVDQFQRQIVVGIFLNHVVKHTTAGLTVSGLENVSKDGSYLFMSNHRDIALDSAFLNYIFAKSGHMITEIAFGDNLMINDFVSNIIRVNRSFVVKRNLKPRDQLKSSLELSRYIRHTLLGNRSIWIAQREGRAKDGNDLSNPAILKMFYLAHRKGDLDFPSFMKSLRIVPVSITYEYDPCDKMKAWELYRKEARGEHVKSKYEDLASMFAGIKGKKGRVHFSIGKPLETGLDNDKMVASTLDKEIHRLYRLWPTNYIAYDELHQTGKYAAQYTALDKTQFLERFRRLSPEVRKYAYETYARPVINQEKATDSLES